MQNVPVRTGSPQAMEQLIAVQSRLSVRELKQSTYYIFVVLRITVSLNYATDFGRFRWFLLTLYYAHSKLPVNLLIDLNITRRYR